MLDESRKTLDSKGLTFISNEALIEVDFDWRRCYKEASNFPHNSCFRKEESEMSRSACHLMIHILVVILLFLVFSASTQADCTGGCSSICIIGASCGSCNNGHSICNTWYGRPYNPDTESCVGVQCNQYFCVSECMAI